MAFTKVQSVSVGTTGSSSATTIAATVSAVGSGNAICGLVSWNNTGVTLTSVTDNQGNTYNLETSILNVNDGQNFAAFSRTNITNAPTVITANFSGSVDYRALGVDEFSGGSTASTDERDGSAHGGQYQSAPGTGTDATTSGTFTTTVNGDLLWGGLGTTFNVSVGPGVCGTGFSAGAGAAGGPNFATEYLTQTTAGSGTAATFTESGTSDSSVPYLIALKPTGAGSSNKTLAAAAGSYTITGTAAALVHKWVVAASAGSYSISGTVSTIRHGWKLPASAGTYALTGTAAKAAHGWKVAASAGTYSLTGTAATIRKNKPLVAVAGSYAITGSAATVLKGKVLSAGFGSYAITGAAAAIKRTWRVTSASGSYALTGADVLLTKASSSNKVLSAGGGSYSLTGTAATVRKGWKVAAAGGSYAITGSAASIRHGWNVAASSGAYAIVGTAATVRHGWKIAAAAGSYVLTGTAATVTKLTTKTLLADPGAYAITGTAVIFKSARRVIAGSGTYSITGTTANVFRGRRVTSGGGVYSITGQAASIVKGQRSVSAQSGAYLLTGSSVDLTYFTPNGPRTDHYSGHSENRKNINEAQRPAAVSHEVRKNVA